MAAKKQYLYAVQRLSGHEVVAVVTEGATGVEVQHMENGLVRLVRDGEVLATGVQYIPEDEELKLHRWPADSKLEEPRSTNVPRRKA